MTFTTPVIPETIVDEHLFNGLSLYGRWLWDISTNLLYWDRHIFKIYGIEEESFSQCQIGHTSWFRASYENFAKLILEEDHEAMWKTLNAAIYTRTPYSFIFRIKNNNQIHHIFSHGMAGYIEGQPLYVSGINCDISSQYQFDARKK